MVWCLVCLCRCVYPYASMWRRHKHDHVINNINIFRPLSLTFSFSVSPSCLALLFLPQLLWCTRAHCFTALPFCLISLLCVNASFLKTIKQQICRWYLCAIPFMRYEWAKCTEQNNNKETIYHTGANEEKKEKENKHRSKEAQSFTRSFTVQMSELNIIQRIHKHTFENLWFCERKNRSCISIKIISERSKKQRAKKKQKKNK